MAKNKLKIKWNSGNLAIVCSRCGGIVKTGVDFTPEETQHLYQGTIDSLPEQYCKECTLRIDKSPNS